MQYAAYANLVHAQQAGSIASSRRVSSESNTSTESSSKKPSKFQRFLNGLKPIDKPITPAGIYLPIIKQGPLFEKKMSTSS
ncbi:hypothetical protein H2198_006933 [Neophaeococcomyces mojaviensis]|uniref:Uncharacterized protein n=1 Tax=Neophaeococcomyces mojaviensis TaxID=3383035 RepID=A0ACC3A1K2_9EURO|nr:hypothetical protein H2198_006933 [Knufia sp. JES_112]